MLYNGVENHFGGAFMNIDTNQIVSVSEANQNFSSVARMAEKEGEIYIFKNNKPKFKPVDIEKDTTVDITGEGKIDIVAAPILKKYRKAFEEPAK